ncbi:MAG: 4-hydroxy-3-methylbut-2-enyl diphosphate reductase [Planctomycetota bacterium]|nr:MAG: 4-hydroxy-3-methylbut-2-enyl diphosphate reductase [Planctomycetota bacterium]
MPKYEDPEVRYTYRSALIDRLREGGELRIGRLRLLMPQSFGFCWGVDRALSMVNDARAEHGDRPMWLLNSIIHNPKVNADMREMGIKFLKGDRAVDGALEGLDQNDVVIVPAFSAMVEEMEYLKDRGVTVVDTTCPWVIKPHKRAQKYVREEFTTVVHGTVGHDETSATCSLVRHHGGEFVIVHDLREAEVLAQFIEGSIDAAALLAGLHPDAVRAAFDPDRHLQKIGVINQTTMLASESRAIADRLCRALENRHGRDALDDCFRDFDTICQATQDNQDAATKVVALKPDLFLVVGGYDSSNTRNLARVGDAAGVPAWHIQGPDCVTGEWIEYRERNSGEIRQQVDWLPSGEVSVAFTAGASTPDAILGMVVERVLEVAGEQLPAELSTELEV